MAKTTTKTAAVNQAGPRGFRFGSVFIQSVIEGAGVAAKPANKAKLVAFAKEMGVAGVTAKTDIEAALKQMAKPANKYLHDHYEVA